MGTDTVRTLGGRSLDELTMEAAIAGDLTPEDFRIHGETLRLQAERAEAAGYGQVAENLRRAAELTRISNDEVLAIYNALRPGRSDHEQLLSLAQRLEEELRAPLTAALIREAAEVYLVRGVFHAHGEVQLSP
jgi:propanediol dehydratase small subunit